MAKWYVWVLIRLAIISLGILPDPSFLATLGGLVSVEKLNGIGFDLDYLAILTQELSATNLSRLVKS